jgi:hypothetical protein
MTTNDITVAKQEFAAVLISAGIKVMDSVPERIVPPVAVINFGSPYLQAASIGSEYLLGIELVLVAQTATNKQATEQLDDLIQRTINALPHYARMTNVGQPYNLQTNNAEYLAANLLLNLRITI